MLTICYALWGLIAHPLHLDDAPGADPVCLRIASLSSPKKKSRRASVPNGFLPGRRGNECPRDAEEEEENMSPVKAEKPPVYNPLEPPKRTHWALANAMATLNMSVEEHNLHHLKLSETAPLSSMQEPRRMSIGASGGRGTPKRGVLASPVPDL
jgi:hypothetical protein